MLPEHLISAVIPSACLTTLVTWQSPRVWGGGAPNLSICSWVMHVEVVCVPPPNGELPPAAIPAGNGDCTQVIVLVTSQSPAFGLCARAHIAAIQRQQPNSFHADPLYFSESATRKRNRFVENLGRWDPHRLWRGWLIVWRRG